MSSVHNYTTRGHTATPHLEHSRQVSTVAYSCTNVTYKRNWAFSISSSQKCLKQAPLLKKKRTTNKVLIEGAFFQYVFWVFACGAVLECVILRRVSNRLFIRLPFDESMCSMLQWYCIKVQQRPAAVKTNSAWHSRLWQSSQRTAKACAWHFSPRPRGYGLRREGGMCVFWIMKASPALRPAHFWLHQKMSKKMMLLW